MVAVATGTGEPWYLCCPMAVGRIMMSSSRASMSWLADGLTTTTPLRRQAPAAPHYRAARHTSPQRFMFRAVIAAAPLKPVITPVP